MMGEQKEKRIPSSPQVKGEVASGQTEERATRCAAHMGENIDCLGHKQVSHGLDTYGRRLVQCVMMVASTRWGWMIWHGHQNDTHSHD